MDVDPADEGLDIAALEASIRNEALEGIPVEMRELGQLKEYYAGVNDLEGLRRLVESLPDAYEMKVPLLEDLALFLAAHGQSDDAISLIASIPDRDDDVRFKYAKSEIYWWAGDLVSSADTLLAASRIAMEPFQYERMLQFAASADDTAGASYCTDLAAVLKSALSPDE